MPTHPLLMGAPLAAMAAVAWAVLFGRYRKRRDRSRWDWAVEILCLISVEAAGVFATWPFFQGTLIGAGDAYHYLLQTADAITQFRHGVFPVMIGQSDYAFNGGIHTIRTAPYYLHLGGLLDLVTGRRLTFAEVQDLTVILSTLGGALTAYYAARRIAPAARFASALLAAAYITSAGLLAPLFHYDMLATILIAPWMPLFWLGIVLSLRTIADREGLLLSVASLGLLWYVHPTFAVWLTPVLVVTQGCRVLLVGRAPGNLVRPVLGAALLSVLVAYVLFSVHTLRSHYDLSTDGAMPRAIMTNLRAAWPGSFLSTIAEAKGPFADLQLGFTLTGVLVFGGFWWVRRGLAGLVLLLVALVFVVLVVPVPGLTFALWRLVPRQVLDMTNSWPMQRFYPLLAGVSLTTGALALASLAQHRRMYAIACALLLAGTGWNLSETLALQKRAHRDNAGIALTAQKLRPENVILTRASYALFGFYPPYFSHGRMDPAFELRLLDENQQVMLDNKGAVLDAAKHQSPPPPSEVIQSEVLVQTDGVHDYLFNFDMIDGTRGTLVIRGNTRQFAYVLPEFGYPKSFGAVTAASSRAFAVRARNLPPEKISVRSEGTKVAMQAIPFLPTDLPLKLDSLIPLQVSVEAARAGLLETPRVFISGYRAMINGQPVPVQRASSGLVAVPVPAGSSKVVIDYPGSPGLVAGFYFSLLGLILTWSWVLAGLWGVRDEPEGTLLNLAAIRRFHLLARRG